MRLTEHRELIEALPAPTASRPWIIMVSGCLAGRPCGVDGTDNGLGDAIAAFLALDTVRAVNFCPEDHTLGTPRATPDIYGGDGFDVLDDRARVLDEHGSDLTEAMVAGAEAMLERAQEAKADLAILTDMSAACGTVVISDGCRLVKDRRYRRGVGVAAALLLRHGIAVVSQRDYRTLGHLLRRLDPSYRPDPSALDHHETEWVIRTFGQ